MSSNAAHQLSLFSLPIAFQVILTPIHLLGFEYYNFPERKFSDRIKFLLPKIAPSIGIRMLRMGAAYGLGGVGNKTYRNYFHTNSEGKNWDSNY